MNEYKRLAIGLGILFGITLTFILYSAFPLITGNTVVLKTRPTDPFGIFRGQYLTINYDISNIPSVKGANQGDYVYVLLKTTDEGSSEYYSASMIKPSDGVFIKGKIIDDNQETMRLQYGIEQYFFERNAEIPQTNITVEVKISSLGQARISKLLYNNEPIQIKYKKPELTS